MTIPTTRRQRPDFKLAAPSAVNKRWAVRSLPWHLGSRRGLIVDQQPPREIRYEWRFFYGKKSSINYGIHNLSHIYHWYPLWSYVVNYMGYSNTGCLTLWFWRKIWCFYFFLGGGIDFYNEFGTRFLSLYFCLFAIIPIDSNCLGGTWWTL